MVNNRRSADARERRIDIGARAVEAGMINTSGGREPIGTFYFRPFMSTVISSAVTKRSRILRATRLDKNPVRACDPRAHVATGLMVKLNAEDPAGLGRNSRNCDRSLINFHLRF
jgi:hypothetical protein